MKQIVLLQAILFFILLSWLIYSKQDVFSYTLGFFIGHFYMQVFLKLGRIFMKNPSILTFGIIILKWFLLGAVFYGIYSFLDVKIFILGLSSMISFWIFFSFHFMKR